MVTKLPFDISVICQVLGLNYGKFYRWIKHHILDYKEEKTQFKLHEHDLIKLTRKFHEKQDNWGLNYYI